VYSQFVSGEGLAIFAKVLKATGWAQYGESEDSDAYGIKNNANKTFAVLSGDIDPEERAKLIKEFNNKSKPIDLLLLSGAVAEGIDLKRVRHVHVMEPFWNYARINQVKTRAIRYLSHEDLPLDERNVQVYIYLSDYPTDYPRIKIKEPTTDVDMYSKSIDNMKIIDSFMLAIAESSIDCSVHYPALDAHVQENLKCKMCSPNNQPLYLTVIHILRKSLLLAKYYYQVSQRNFITKKTVLI
jgi:superfamily II DNA or RNA helicase